MVKGIQINSILLMAIIITASKAETCGGLLRSDGGTQNLPNDFVISRDTDCVWVIQLLSKGTVKFTLNRMDSSQARVNLYPEHDASKEAVLAPIRISSSDTGIPMEFPGQTLLVVVSDLSGGLSFSWEAVPSVTADAVPTSAYYVDTGHGRVLWNRIQGNERLTLAFNWEPTEPSSFKADINFGVEQSRPCSCSSFGLYEISSNGELREITRVCGHSATFDTQGSYSKILAIIYINSTCASADTDYVELSWTKEEATTTENLAEEYSDTDIIELECGGLVRLSGMEGSSTFVGYKNTQEYDNYERCLWTLDFENGENATRYGVVIRVTLVSHCIEEGYDGFAVLNWTAPAGLSSSLLQAQTAQEFHGHRIFLSFTSDSAGTGQGFLLKIQVISLIYNDIIGEGVYYSALSGSHSLGPYGHYERASIAINPPSYSFQFTVDHIDIELSSPNCSYDSLLIFEVQELGRVNYGHRLCGRNQTDVLKMFTEWPILVLFSSDHSYSYNGFEISWAASSSEEE